jgi:hypothetical protein
VTAGEGEVDSTGCVCKEGLYLDGSECLDCEESAGKGTKCDQPGVTLEDLPLTKGYWRVTSTSVDVLLCLTEAACPGEGHLKQNATVWADRFCAEGSRGPLCGVCDEGFRREANGDCAACGGAAGAWGAFAASTIAIIIAILLLMAWCRKRQQERKFGKPQKKGRAARAVGILIIVAKALEEGRGRHKSKLRILVPRARFELAIS